MPDRSGRRRSSDSDVKIAETTLELLRAHGPSAVTIEGVAATSGVARTTIYRRFPDRNAMLSAALLTVPVPNVVGEGATLHDRVRSVVEGAAAMIFDGIGFGGIAALITDPASDFAVVFRQILMRHREALAAALPSDSALRDNGMFEVFVDAIVGALIAEFARTGGIADGWSDRLARFFEPLAGTA